MILEKHDSVKDCSCNIVVMPVKVVAYSVDLNLCVLGLTCVVVTRIKSKEDGTIFTMRRQRRGKGEDYFALGALKSLDQ
jgi:hypothetical protein